MGAIDSQAIGASGGWGAKQGEKAADRDGAWGKGFNLWEGDFFGSNKLIEPASVSAARDQLFGMAQDPRSPQRQIQGLDPLELLMNQMMQQFAQSGPSETRQVAKDTALGFANAGDGTQNDGVKALMNMVLGAGQQNERNTERGLRKQGNSSLSSSKGAQVKGEAEAKTREAVTAAVLPFIEANAQRKFASISMLDQIASMEQAEKLTKMEVGDRAGAKLRQVKQMALDEAYNTQMANFEARGNWLMSLLGTNPGGTMYQKGHSDRVQDVLNGGKTVQSTMSGYFSTFGGGGKTGAS